jgi:hypothetical protein
VAKVDGALLLYLDREVVATLSLARWLLSQTSPAPTLTERLNRA